MENGSEKDFGSRSNYEISVFICRKFLNEKNEFDSEDFYSDMGEEDIINTKQEAFVIFTFFRKGRRITWNESSPTKYAARNAVIL